MLIRATAASPESGESLQAVSPRIQASAHIHSAAQINGDVRIQANVQIAPGACLKAEPGACFQIGADVLVQEGAALHGLSHSQVLGDDQTAYSIWVGAGSSITYKVLVHGPAYIGDGCFIGFRSTLINARVGHSCIVMMHTLLQDVEIPPGKLVPSGAVITRQEQADQLPDAGPADWILVKELLGDSRVRLDRYRTNAASVASVATGQDEYAPEMQLNERDGFSTMQSQQLTPEIMQRVRQYLAQGLRIGTEHADVRRYRSNVWQTCSPIQASRDTEVFAALEACLREHAGEYVRLFGIDPVAKQRVAPITIQRPDGKPVRVDAPNGAVVSTRPSVAPRAYAGTAVGGLSAEVVQQVRSYLAQGLKIGTEHADRRRYRSNVWQTCSPIQSNHESEVLNALQGCLAEHADEYVRLFGIDPVAKRRVAPVTIQQPGGQAVPLQGRQTTGSMASSASPGLSRQGATTDVSQQVRQWLQMGFQIGAEHADARRYRSNVWQTCPSISGRSEAEAMAAINACLAEHPGEYVRIFGIDPVAKNRVAPITVQRPGSSSTATSAQTSFTQTAKPSSSAGSSFQNTHSNGSGAGQPLPPDLVQQVHQLLNQGYRVSLEHADRRRYRSGAWQTSASLDGVRNSDILSALEARLREHRGEYVRLIGIDPRAKRRVLETTIQRP